MIFSQKITVNSESLRAQFTWTPLQQERLRQVQSVLEELNAYKPLTLRQVYYQLVGKGYIENTKSQYGMLSRLLKWARIHGHVPWDDIEDRVRAFHSAEGWEDKETFIAQETRNFLRGYRRDLLQTQEKYLEVWIEKDALSSVFRRVCDSYSVSVVVCRGFSSVSFLHDFQERLDNYEDRELIMLYFGDFDPSGMEMMEAMKKTLTDELGVSGISFRRVALTLDDVHTYQLPHRPEALKKTDTRAKKYIATYGDIAVELDALPPDVLEEKIHHAIEEELDMDLFQEEREREDMDAGALCQLKQKTISFLQNED